MRDISCAAMYGCAVSVSGEIYSWGSIATGQLGVGEVSKDFLQFSSSPLRIDSLIKKRIRQVSCGRAHAAAVSTNGELYVWGCANGYRLGLGDHVKDCVPQPVCVTQLRNHRVWQVRYMYTYTTYTYT